jgi:hypothetical protein
MTTTVRRHRANSLSVAVLLAVTAPPGLARGDEPPAAPGRLTLVTERVVVFKDGYALFVKGAVGTADADGRVHTDAVPDAAVLGCVWAVTGKDHERLLAMRSAWHETKETRTRETACTTTLELLRANVGQRVTLGLTREKAADVAGTLVEVLDLPPEAPAVPPPGAPRPAGPVGEFVTEVVPRGGSLVVVQGDQGRIALPVAEVRTVSGPDLATRTKRVEDVVRRAKRLSFELGKESAGRQAGLRLFYFAEGVRWIPTYRVGGEVEKDAHVALQAEVVNEAEDLAGAAVDLVVGVPSFRFRDVASPLTLERAMRGALQAAAPQLAGQFQNRLSNVFSNDESQVEVGAGGGAPATPAELLGAGEQDFFVYPVGSLSLERGARATVPLWQAVAPLRHLYTMDVQVVRNQRSGEHSYQSLKSSAAPPRGGTARTSASPVWHELELSNTGSTPWTTGAALLLKGTLPLGQDVLGYTPPGGKTLLPMTVAVDLRGKYAEREIERRSNALNWSSATYSLVRKEGTVTITSYRREASPVRVTVSVGGRAEDATEGGKILVNDLRADDWAGGAYAVNNHSDVSWEFVLEPGQTKTLSYTFSFYVQ